MTAKRFTLKEYTIGDYAILDDGTEIAYASHKSAFTFCELLNKLHEENEERKRAMRIAEHYNEQLVNENKQLKKYIDSIRKGGLE